MANVIIQWKTCRVFSVNVVHEKRQSVHEKSNQLKTEMIFANQNGIRAFYSHNNDNNWEMKMENWKTRNKRNSPPLQVTRQ